MGAKVVPQTVLSCIQHFLTLKLLARAALSVRAWFSLSSESMDSWTLAALDMASFCKMQAAEAFSCMHEMPSADVLNQNGH